MAWPSLYSKHQNFEYPSLRSKPRAFRVIKLLPLTRSSFPPFRERLNIEIIETNVDDADGKYDTLSYCWGTGVPDRAVTIWPSSSYENSGEHRTIYISASLESALLSLAREKNVHPSRPIFADQICINQGDNAEKIQQVRLMGEVYARSARAVVWLGEGTAETSRYYDFLSELSSEGILSRVMGPNVAWYMNVFDAVIDSSIELETGAEREDRDDILDLIARYGPRFPLRGLTEMLRRAWANRLWTVQEGCLPAAVTFRCGKKSLCYDCVRGGLLFHSIWTTYWGSMPQPPVSEDEIRAKYDIYALNEPFLRMVKERKAIHGIQSRRRSLYEVVLQYNVNNGTSKIGATKPEDRIYALLGLAGEDEIERETIENMEVDNVRGTFTQFASSVIKGNMDVLLFSQMPKSPTHGHRLPSWVPDWSADPLRTPHGYADLTTPVFSAGGNRDADHVAVHVPTGVLRVNAIPVGRVIRVGVRSIQPDESATIENIEYMSARHFFDEIEEFMDAAAQIDPIHAPDISDLQCRLESTIRLSDGGLSARQFPTEFDPATAPAMLREIHRHVSHLGQQYIDVEAQTRSMTTFIGMIRSAGVMPWHWTPASEIDVIRLCAVDPIMAAGIWMKGLFLTISDVGLVMWHIARLRLHVAIIRFRRNRVKLDLHRQYLDTVMRDVGLENNFLGTREWRHHTSNLLKNIGRKLFLTDTGYVGLAPGNTKEEDEIVVIPGGSVPHILRSQTVSKDLDHEGRSQDVHLRSYVGEAYCDGIMDGELLRGGDKATRTFEII
ncbi:heterokaryon incompatibility protein-domain-containing protein [Nemania serpens]|nr:heterokaryon incompatibility protein-domain-containing protein [Nemania serpens]